MNPATWMLDVLNAGKPSEDGTRRSSRDYVGDGVDFEAEFRASAQYDAAIKTLSETEGLAPVQPAGNRPSFMTQLSTVYGRFNKSYYRNVGYNGARLVAFPILGLLFGLIYFDLDQSDVIGVQATVNLLTVACSFMAVVHLQAGAPVFMGFRPTFYREQAAHMYRSMAYTIGLGLVEVPYIAFCSLLSVSCFYFLVRLDLSLSVFFHTVFIFFALALALSYHGMFLVGALPNSQVNATYRTSDHSPCPTTGCANLAWIFPRSLLDVQWGVQP